MNNIHSCHSFDLHSTILMRYALQSDSPFQFKTARVFNKLGLLRSRYIRRLFNINLDHLTKKVNAYALRLYPSERKSFLFSYLNLLKQEWKIEQVATFETTFLSNCLLEDQGQESSSILVDSKEKTFFKEKVSCVYPQEDHVIEDIKLLTNNSLQQKALDELNWIKDQAASCFLEELHKEVSHLSEDQLRAFSYTLKFQDDSLSIHYPIWRHLKQHSYYFQAFNTSFNESIERIISFKDLYLKDFILILRESFNLDKSDFYPSENMYLLLDLSCRFGFTQLEEKYRKGLFEYLKSQTIEEFIALLEQDYSLNAYLTYGEMASLHLSHLIHDPEKFKSLVDLCVKKGLPVKQLHFSGGQIKTASLEQLVHLPITHLTFEKYEGDFNLLRKFSSLTHLSLNRCVELKGEKFAFLSDLKKLQFLSLCGCHMTDKELIYLQESVELQSLDLSWCQQFIGDGLTYLQKATKLQLLNVSNCSKFTGEKLSCLQNAPQLHSLNLSECQQITPHGFLCLQNLRGLRSLNLSKCLHVTHKELASLHNLTTLHFLNLSGCQQIIHEGFCELQKCTELESLNLSNCLCFTDKEMVYLQPLTKLKSLHLSGCWQIGDEGLLSLQKLINLQFVDLSWCAKITKKGKDYIETLKNLQFIELYGCSTY